MTRTQQGADSGVTSLYMRPSRTSREVSSTKRDDGPDEGTVNQRGRMSGHIASSEHQGAKTQLLQVGVGHSREASSSPEVT